MPFPARMFEPEPMFNRIASFWTYAPYTLRKAGELKDPLERMKLAITMAIAGL